MQTMIKGFLENLAARQIEIRALSVYRGGQKLLEHYWAPFGPDDLYPVYSETKSFLSVLIGWQIEEGRLYLNDTWLSFFPEYEAVAAPGFEKVTIRQMLTMSLGQKTEIAIREGEDWVRKVLAEPLTYEPGTVFLYNSHISNLLGLLVERLSGHSFMEELKIRIFEPLGITGAVCETDLEGRALAGLGLHLKHRDMVRFGQAIANGGWWEEKQICPASWIRESGKKQMDNAPAYPPENIENRAGYGYHFWLCSRGGCRCSGLYGQLCYIWPEEDLLVVANSATEGNAAILSCLYDALDAEAQAGSSGKEAAAKEMAAETAHTTEEPVRFGHLPLLQGEKDDPGKQCPSVTLQAEENPYGITSLALTQEEESIQCAIVREGTTYRFAADYGVWRAQPDAFTPFCKHMLEALEAPHFHRTFQAPQLYANYAWEAPGVLRVQIRAIDFSGRPEFTFTWSGGTVRMVFKNESYLTNEPEMEVSFGAAQKE